MNKQPFPSTAEMVRIYSALWAVETYEAEPTPDLDRRWTIRELQEEFDRRKMRHNGQPRP